MYIYIYIYTYIHTCCAILRGAARRAQREQRGTHNVGIAPFCLFSCYVYVMCSVCFVLSCFHVSYVY